MVVQRLLKPLCKSARSRTWLNAAHVARRRQRHLDKGHEQHEGKRRVDRRFERCGVGPRRARKRAKQHEKANRSKHPKDCQRPCRNGAQPYGCAIKYADEAATKA